jgi:transcriptional regulator with XRE-family HTH domain
MTELSDVFFTLLTDPLQIREGQPVVHPSAIDLYGAYSASPESPALKFTDSDLKDNRDAREALVGRVPSLRADDYSVPLFIPPSALRPAVASAVWLLLRRWSRGRWPFKFFRDRGPKSLRQVSERLEVDPGQMSRVASASAMFSLPALTRFLRSGGYRLAISDADGAALKKWIENEAWRENARATITTAMTGRERLPGRDLPLPTLLPTRPGGVNFERLEALYLEELDQFIENHDVTGVISRPHLYRVRKGERSLSLDMLAMIASELRFSFIFVPILMTMPNWTRPVVHKIRPQITGGPLGVDRRIAEAR